MSDRATATAYPTSDQYQQWKERAEGMGMSTSEYIKHMVEAGHKKFSGAVEPDETNKELRNQRNDLTRELDRTRQRVEELEQALHRTERRAIVRYIKNNPGASHREIVQHIIDTSGSRTTRHLEELDGGKLEKRGNDWYPAEEVDG